MHTDTDTHNGEEEGEREREKKRETNRWAEENQYVLCVLCVCVVRIVCMRWKEGGGSCVHVLERGGNTSVQRVRYVCVCVCVCMFICI